MVKEMPGDQVAPGIRDSEIKFECRLISSLFLDSKGNPKVKVDEVMAMDILEIVGRIIDIENKRLNLLKEQTNERN